MNEPIFKISGKERRELKKKLSLLKYSHKMFWHYEDVAMVYGTSMEDNDAKKSYDDLKKQIDSLESILSEKL